MPPPSHPGPASPRRAVIAPTPSGGGAVVGVVVNTVGGYSRGVVRGITSFAVSRGWTLRVEGVNETAIDERSARYDGLIVQAGSAALAKRFVASAAAGTPAVNVSSSLTDSGLPTVITDDVAVGRLGADHFVRAGYRTLIFYAPDRRAFARTRHEGFRQRAADAGVETRLIATEEELTALIRGAELPKPMSIMGCNDRAALAVLDVCRALAVRIPDDTAVLGVDDDDLVQAMAYPPLSTVNTARDRVGFEAAAMLERLMAGDRDAPGLVLVAPKGVVARRSTDATAIADTDVAEAARFIHAHAGRAISVEDVARAASVSRRQLERRFRAAMGHSLLAEITRCRVDRARQLLVDTELTLDQISRAAGFASASYFSVVFKRQADMTPQKYRDAFRGR